MPKLNISLDPFLTQEILLQHAVDVADLKQSRPLLENVIYAPLEHPWLTMPIVLGGAILIVLVRCRTNINCNLAKTKRRSSSFEQDPPERQSSRTVQTQPPMKPEAPTKVCIVDTAKPAHQPNSMSVLSSFSMVGKKPEAGSRGLAGLATPEHGSQPPSLAPSPPNHHYRVTLH